MRWDFQKMFKLLRMELGVLNSSKALPIGILLIAFSCIGVSLVEFNYVQFGTGETFYINFMLYNATFAVIKIFIPILVLLLVASVWGGEYANGMIKSFLLCNVGKTEMFAGKFVFLLISSAISFAVAFVAFTVICVFRCEVGSISFNAILMTANVYAVISVGLLPIILLTTIASILFGDFQKGISFGFVLLFLSLSLDTVFENNYMTPTYFLSHGSAIYNSKISGAAFIVLAIYTIVFTFIGFIALNKKDIWQ